MIQRNVDILIYIFVAISISPDLSAARSSFPEYCDYQAYYCLRSYNAGKLCGRTRHYSHHTFKNKCSMDYVNCMKGYEVWQIVHMGPCFNVTELAEHLKYPYDDDCFLDHYYILENQ